MCRLVQATSRNVLLPSMLLLYDFSDRFLRFVRLQDGFRSIFYPPPSLTQIRAAILLSNLMVSSFNGIKNLQTLKTSIYSSRFDWDLEAVLGFCH